MDRKEKRTMPSEPEFTEVAEVATPVADLNQLPGNQVPAEFRPEVAGLHEGGLVCTCGQVAIPRGKTEMGMVPSVFGEPGYVHRIPEEVTGEIRDEDGNLLRTVTNGGGPCHELS